MQRRKFNALSPFTIAALAALILAGCTNSDQSPQPSPSGEETQPENPPEGNGTDDKPEANPTGSNGEAVLSYDDTTFTAQLQFCSLTGGEDSLFHGVAHDDAGAEVGYLDGDFGGLSDAPYGEVRIDFGATARAQSTDEFIAMGDAAGHIVITDSSDTSLIIVGGVWDQDGTQLSTATLRVNC